MKIKVYHVDSNIGYEGFALVGAETAEEANSYINNFKKRDPNGIYGSSGWRNVNEFDALDAIYAEEKGILADYIFYCGPSNSF